MSYESPFKPHGHEGPCFVKAPSAALYDGYRQGQKVAVADLSGRAIGKVISFKHRLPKSFISTVVIAELRQISHGAGITTLSCQCHDEDRLATLEEFDMSEDCHVVFMEAI